MEVNNDKTTLFLAGVDKIEDFYIESFGFGKGSFPIRYLGLPLMFGKLRISEYTPVLAKIVGRFTKWAIKSLSFAERR